MVDLVVEPEEPEEPVVELEEPEQPAEPPHPPQSRYVATCWCVVVMSLHCSVLRVSPCAPPIVFLLRTSLVCTVRTPDVCPGALLMSLALSLPLPSVRLPLHTENRRAERMLGVVHPLPEIRF